MTMRKRDTKAILRSIERGSLRSSLFWWMVENHDEMLRTSQRRRIDWATFCVEAEKRGLADTRGQAPSERNARETWLQARKVVAEARAAEAKKSPSPPGSIYPSRIPRDWRPEIVQPVQVGQSESRPAARAETPPVPPARPRPGRALSVLASPDDPPEVQQMMAEVEQQLRKADRYLGLPVKRRDD